MHFLCNISYRNLLFSVKKIKNWGRLLNTEAGSFILLVNHRSPSLAGCKHASTKNIQLRQGSVILFE